MTTGAPAGTLAQTRGVINPADQDGRPVLDLLEMAFQTQVHVAFGEHLDVDTAVRGMAGGAAFAQGFVLKNKRSLLGRMALNAIFLLRKQLGAAAGMGDALVGGMALDAIHPALGHGMMIGQIELAAHIHVTLVTGGLDLARRFEREPSTQRFRLRPAGGEAVRRFGFAAGIRVQATGPVTGFAAGIEPVIALGDEPGVVGGLEAAINFVVALFAFRGADVLRAGNIRKHHRAAAEGAAGNRRQQQNGHAGGERQVPAARWRRFDEWKFFHADFLLSFIARIFGKRAVGVACCSWL